MCFVVQITTNAAKNWQFVLIACCFCFPVSFPVYLPAPDGTLLACPPSCCLISSEAAVLRILSTVRWC